MNDVPAAPFIEARDLQKTYRTGGGDVRALGGVRLAVGRGEFLSIVGPSGCGKSTLLYILGGLMTPTAGSVRVGGEEIGGLRDAALARFRARRIGFVFQRFNLVPTLTVAENIALARRIRGPGGATVPLDELLERVGLAGKARRRPPELSMGEQQRAAVARAVAHRPAILLADEPTGNLDTANSDRILELFGRMHREFGQTILLVTHNPDAARAAGRTVRMRDGMIE
ncbi:MAG: ABC transporter ATP-binding protein [bacterium]|nr:ABC transporter ATP-binding protein [bacterium]